MTWLVEWYELEIVFRLSNELDLEVLSSLRVADDVDVVVSLVDNGGSVAALCVDDVEISEPEEFLLYLVSKRLLTSSPVLPTNTSALWHRCDAVPANVMKCSEVKHSFLQSALNLPNLFGQVFSLKFV